MVICSIRMTDFFLFHRPLIYFVMFVSCSTKWKKIYIIHYIYFKIFWKICSFFRSWSFPFYATGYSRLSFICLVVNLITQYQIKLFFFLTGIAWMVEQSNWRGCLHFWATHNWSKMAFLPPISQEWDRNGKIASMAPLVSSLTTPHYSESPNPLGCDGGGATVFGPSSRYDTAYLV